MKRSMLALIATGVLLAASMPASGQNPSFTPGWEGEWEFTSMIRTCGSGVVDTTEVDTTTICAGDIFGEEGYACSGTITDSMIDLDCSFEIDFRPELDCVATFSLVINGTLSGNSVSGTQTESETYVGTECFAEDYCDEETITGVRLNPSPAICQAPVEPVSWGRIKATYD